MSKLTAGDLCKNKSLFPKSAEEQEVRVHENAGMEKIPESQARKYTPLNINLKGEDTWDLEMALWMRNPSRTTDPPGIWISLSGGGSQASAEHAACLKRFAALKSLLDFCSRGDKPWVWLNSFWQPACHISQGWLGLSHSSRTQGQPSPNPAPAQEWRGHSCLSCSGDGSQWTSKKKKKN